MNRRKAFRVSGFVLLYSASGILGLYLLLLVLLHLPPVQNYLLSILETQISSAVRGKLEVKSFRTDLVSFIDFSEIGAYVPGEEDSLFLQKITLDYSFLSLLNREVRIDAVGIREGSAYLVRDSTGNLQFPLIPAARREARPDTAEGVLPGPWKLVVDTGFVQNLDVVYRDSQLDLFTVLESLHIAVKSPNLDSLMAEVSSEHIRLRSPWWNGTLDTLYAIGRRDDSLITLKRFLLSGNPARISLGGTIPLFLQAPFNLNGKARGKLAPFSDLFIPDTLSGSFNADFNARGTLESPRMRAVVTSPFIRYRTIALDSAYLHARYTESQTLQISSFLRNPLGTVRARGDLGIPGLIFSPSLGGYNVQVNADVADIAQLLREAGLMLTQVNGTADLDLYARGDSLVSLPDSLFMTVTANETGQPDMDTVRARVALDKNRWDLETLLGRGNRISGRGVVTLPRAIRGDLQGTVSNPQLITEFFMPEPVTGSLELNASFSDILENPRLRIGVRSDSLAWRGVTAEQLEGELRYNKLWTIDKSAALFLADLGEVRIPGFERVEGMLRADVSAKGAFPLPVVQADVEITDPEYAEYKGERIETRLLIENQTLFWDRLVVRTDTFRLASTGQINLLSSQLAWQTELQLAARERPAARLFLEGAFVNDSLYASTMIEHLVPGRIFPDLPFFVCYEGGAEVRAVAGQGNCLSRGSLDFDLIQFAPALPQPYTISGNAGFFGNVLDAEVQIHSGDDPDSSLVVISNLLFESICPDTLQPIGEGSFVRVLTRDFSYGQLISSYFPGFMAEGEITGDIVASRENGDWFLGGEANITADTLAYPPLDLHVSNAVVTLSPQGTSSSPQGEFNVTARGLEYADEKVQNAAAVGSLDSGEISVRTLVGTFNDSGFISASGVIPFSTMTGDTRFEFELEHMPLAFVNPILGAVFIEEGTMTGRGVVELGEKIDSDGVLFIEDMRMNSDVCELSSGPVSAQLFLVNDSVVLSSLKGELGNGIVAARGFAQLGLWKVKDFALDFGARGVRVMCEDFVELGLGGARGRFRKTEEGYALQTTVSFAETRLDQVVTLQEIVDRALTQIPRGPVPSVMRETEVDATLVLNRNFLIDTNLGRFLLDGQLTVGGTLARPRFNGVLTMAEGTVRYLDREFEIEEGTLRQYDPFEINPELDISASIDVQAITFADPADYTITVSVRGTLREPEVAITSSPPLQTQEILNLLTLGTGEADAGLPRTGQIVSSHVTGLGSQLLEQAFGIDNISVTGNLFAVTENAGLTFTIREDVTSRLTVVYQSDILNPANQGILVSYRLFPRLRLTGRTQTEGSSEIGFDYTIRR
ncbi:MAG: translocation/assembly module TamB domain-containing protein [Chitinispirillaceae bacterium]